MKKTRTDFVQRPAALTIDKTVTEKICRKVFRQKKYGGEVMDPPPKKH